MTDLKELSTEDLRSKISKTTKQLCQNTSLSAHLVDLKIRELQLMQKELHQREAKQETAS